MPLRLAVTMAATARAAAAVATRAAVWPLQHRSARHVGEGVLLHGSMVNRFAQA